MNQYLALLKKIHKAPQAFQSNHFRGNAAFYAEAASRGHISALDSGMNAGVWKITQSGLTFLFLNTSASNY